MSDKSAPMHVMRNVTKTADLSHGAVAAVTGPATMAFHLTAAPAAVTYVAKLSGVPQTAQTVNGAAMYLPIQLSLTTAGGQPAPAGVPVTWQCAAASAPAVGCAMYSTANEAAATLMTDAQGSVTLDKLSGYSVMAKGIGAYKVSISSGPIGTTIVNLTLAK